MADYEPLNGFLYNRLTAMFGEVIIAKQGEAMIAELIPGTTQYNFSQKGEYYRVNCPFCKESRQRLWVSHMWGVPDRHDKAHWWMAHCFNEKCMEDEAYRKQLISMVYKGVGREQRRSTFIAKGRRDTGVVGPVDWPGPVTPINQLHPSHPAAIYLRDERGYDLDLLYHRWQVHFHQGYCANYQQMTDRIVIPVFYNGQMVCWQGRYVGTTDWRMTPKYYTRKDSSKSKLLYNYDVARQSPFGALVEGPTDVWALPDISVAMLGDSLSETQAELILRVWRALLVIVDDDDAYYRSEDTFVRLNQKIPVIRVNLPQGTDPDSIDNEYLWSLIDGSAQQRGVDLLELAKR